MTATHQCEICETATTHVLLEGTTLTGDTVHALRCIVCGNVVPIEIHDEPED